MSIVLLLPEAPLYERTLQNKGECICTDIICGNCVLRCCFSQYAVVMIVLFDCGPKEIKCRNTLKADNDHLSLQSYQVCMWELNIRVCACDRTACRNIWATLLMGGGLGKRAGFAEEER